MGRPRFYPCAVYGCPECTEPGQSYCARHRRASWKGRNGTTRRAAIGVSERTWRHLKRACLVRDGHRCRICGAPGDVPDHLIPVAWRKPPVKFGEHLASLMTLCEPCHHRKTSREAVLGRTHGSPPPHEMIGQHIQWWLSQARTPQTIIVDRGTDAAR